MIKIDPARSIGDLIGPSGKHIRGIVETTGAKIDVEDDGKVFICTRTARPWRRLHEDGSGPDGQRGNGKVYDGKVVGITDFGASWKSCPRRTDWFTSANSTSAGSDKVTDVCREGDMMKVKVIAIDPTGKVRLSRRAALEEEPGFVPPEGYKPRPAGERPERPSHDRHDRGPRSGGHDRGDRGSSRGGHDRDRGHDRGTRPSSSHSAPSSHDAPKDAVDRGGVDRGGKSDGEFEADLR